MKKIRVTFVVQKKKMYVANDQWAGVKMWVVKVKDRTNRGQPYSAMKMKMLV